LAAGVVDHEVEQPRQRGAERRPLAVPGREQIVAVDCEVREPVRSLALLLDAPLESREVLELPRLDALRARSASLVEQEPSRAVDPVRGEEAAREQAVDRAVQPERVARHEPLTSSRSDVRVAQPPHHPPAMPAPTRAWSGAGAVGLGLAEVVQQRAEAHAQLRAELGRPWTTANRCSSSGPGWPGRAEVVPDHRRTPGGTRRAHPCPARAGAPRPAALPSRSFESSPMPSASTPPPMRSPETCRRTGRLRAHLRQRRRS
jgi:hypothetical protein